MANQPLIHIVGITMGDPAKVDEFNRWYNAWHSPMLLTFPGALRADRYQKAEGDEKYPDFLAVYQWEGEKAFKAYRKSELRKQILQEAIDKWPGEHDFIRVWNTAYKHIASIEK